MRSLVLVLIILASQPTRAQAQSKDFKERDVVVQLDDRTAPVRGRLILMDNSRVVIRFPDVSGNSAALPTTTTYPIERVRYVEAAEPDSVIEGAILGALYLAACARWWCNQGASGGDGPDLPKDVLLGAGLGALVGARVDAAFKNHERLYEAPKPRSSTELPPATVAVRFTF
jgi:hypothetical protein